MAQKPLIEVAREFYARALASPEAKRLLRGNMARYHGYCRFIVRDGEPFYFELKAGQGEVKPGRINESSYDFPRITADEKTLRDLFAGRIRPVAAKRAKLLEFNCRDRRGGLFNVIIRIGQDIIREETLERFLPGGDGKWPGTSSASSARFPPAEEPRPDDSAPGCFDE